MKPIATNLSELLMALKQETQMIQEQQIKSMKTAHLVDQNINALTIKMEILKKLNSLIDIKMILIAILSGSMTGVIIFLILYQLK